MPTIKKLPKRSRTTDTFKSKARHRFYAQRRWARLRAEKLRQQPLCEMCLSRGRVTPAEDVHHKISFMSSDDACVQHHLFYDFDNLMSLCKECHGAIHAGVIHPQS